MESDELMPHEVQLIKQKDVIQAVKSVRDRRMISLKEAKDIVDRFREKYAIEFWNERFGGGMGEASAEQTEFVMTLKQGYEDRIKSMQDHHQEFMAEFFKLQTENAELRKKLGIAEADDAVEVVDSNLNEEERALATDPNGGLIPAIRAYRERTQAGLRDAKDTVEAYLKWVGAKRPNGQLY